MTISKDLVAIASGSGTALYKAHECTTIFGTQTELLHLIVYGVIGGAAGYLGKLFIDVSILIFKKFKQ